MRQFILKLQQRMTDLGSLIAGPLKITIEEYDAVVFFKNGKIVRASGKIPKSLEQLEHFRKAFRSMDRAFDSMNNAFKEMDDAFQHMEHINRKKE